MTTRFISTAIPYVNAAPHLGFAMELVIADAIARHERQRGGDTYFLSGTDDNSVKNALAAEAAGVSTRAFVAERSAEFAALKRLLNLSYDDFLRTSADPRHAPAVTRLWNACLANGDIAVGEYTGLYCTGCEQFYVEAELTDGRCVEHGTVAERVAERNYFFRLRRYQDELIRLIQRDEIAIRPKEKKHEVLAFLAVPLVDLSVSRSIDRARGWGLPVPGDPSQMIYVWFDALANYVSALGYATGATTFERYWTKAQRITHVIGKGVLRFHAVYWPAILLSAGLRPPSEILVHGYVTVDGRKIGKSLGNALAPEDACRPHGTDALRYYLLRHIGSHRDGDFARERLALVYRQELANHLGNLVSRTTALGRKYGVPSPSVSRLGEGLQHDVDRCMDDYEVHRALDCIWSVIASANRYVSDTAPWKIAKEGDAAAVAAVLGELYATLRCIGETLRPFLPDAAERMLRAIAASSAEILFPTR